MWFFPISFPREQVCKLCVTLNLSPWPQIPSFYVCFFIIIIIWGHGVWVLFCFSNQPWPQVARGKLLPGGCRSPRSPLRQSHTFWFPAPCHVKQQFTFMFFKAANIIPYLLLIYISSHPKTIIIINPPVFSKWFWHRIYHEFIHAPSRYSTIQLLYGHSDVDSSWNKHTDHCIRLDKWTAPHEPSSFLTWYHQFISDRRWVRTSNNENTRTY